MNVLALLCYCDFLIFKLHADLLLRKIIYFQNGFKVTSCPQKFFYFRIIEQRQKKAFNSSETYDRHPFQWVAILWQITLKYSLGSLWTDIQGFVVFF